MYGEPYQDGLKLGFEIIPNSLEIIPNSLIEVSTIRRFCFGGSVTRLRIDVTLFGATWL